MKLHIDEDTCKGCGLCTLACPKQVLALSTDRINAKGYHPVRLTDEAGCILCASCARMCPDTAIEIY